MRFAWKSEKTNSLALVKIGGAAFCRIWNGKLFGSLKRKSMNWLRKALKLPLNLALNSSRLRQKVVYELRRQYFSDLQFQIPLNRDLPCPIYQERFAWSFSEIFLNAEYGDF